MQARTFVFFGNVGSGKGTQTKLLADFLKAKDGRESVYAGMGEGFRKILESGNYTAELIKDSMARGQLVDDFLTNAIFTNMLVSSLTPEKHLFADGYPRTVAQAEVFEEMMQFFKRGPIEIVYINVSKEEAKQRNLLRGRHDDTEEGLAKRFDEYEKNVVPAMNYLKGRPGYTVHTVTGEQPIEKVHQDIIKALGY